jgi:hypothetical protein
MGNLKVRAEVVLVCPTDVELPPTVKPKTNRLTMTLFIKNLPNGFLSATPGVE